MSVKDVIIPPPTRESSSSVNIPIAKSPKLPTEEEIREAEENLEKMWEHVHNGQRETRKVR